MTEVEVLQQILSAQQLEVNLLGAMVAGVGFIAAGVFWLLVRLLMKERHF
jgi:hypothetical protein